MKKILLTLSAAASVAAPIATTISCGSDVNPITGIGSNSVTPLTDVMGKEYSSPIEYTNTGSSNGHRSQVAAAITHDFGMMSSSPESKTTASADATRQWAENGIRTLTYAIDAVGVSYNANLMANGSSVTIKLTELQKLYNPATAADERPTWQELTVEDLNGTDADTKPTPVFVTGGKGTSGKSEAFVKQLTFGLSDEQKSYFENHTGLTGTGVADESLAIYNAANDTANTIVYHSLGFLVEQEKQSSNKLKLAGIAFDSATAATPPTIENVEDGSYGWIRPFNMLYSVSNEKSVKLAEWLLGSYFQNQVAALGFVKLTQAQITLQSETVTLTTPDLDVAASGDSPAITGANNTDGINYGIL